MCPIVSEISRGNRLSKMDAEGGWEAKVNNI